MTPFRRRLRGAYVRRRRGGIAQVQPVACLSLSRTDICGPHHSWARRSRVHRRQPGDRGDERVGPGFAVTIQALSESGQPWNAPRFNSSVDKARPRNDDRDGKVDLTLYGELPETVTELFVKGAQRHWACGDIGRTFRPTR